MLPPSVVAVAIAIGVGTDAVAAFILVFVVVLNRRLRYRCDTVVSVIIFAFIAALLSISSFSSPLFAATLSTVLCRRAIIITPCHCTVVAALSKNLHCCRAVAAATLSPRLPCRDPPSNKPPSKRNRVHARSLARSCCRMPPTPLRDILPQCGLTSPNLQNWLHLQT